MIALATKRRLQPTSQTRAPWLLGDPVAVAWLQRQPGLAIWETHHAGDAWQRERSPCWGATGTAEVPRLLNDAA